MTTKKEKKKKLRLKESQCSNCGGHGVYWNFSWDEPDECRNCGGSGRIFVTENDRLLAYPSGPFLGSAPRLFKELEEAGVKDYDWKPAPSKEELFQELSELYYEIEIAAKAIERILIFNEPKLREKDKELLSDVINYLKGKITISGYQEYPEMKLFVNEKEDGD
jgi:hypothetical protein